MPRDEFLIEMTFTPFASLPSAAELVAFIERLALPTLEALERLAASGRIAGGPPLAGGGFTFIARAGSPAELEERVAALPLWPRAQVRVTPLATFGSRTARMRERLARAKLAAQEPSRRPDAPSPFQP
jgi:hypothetical protein